MLKDTILSYLSDEAKEKYTHTPSSPMDNLAMSLFANDGIDNLQDTLKAYNSKSKNNDFKLMGDKQRNLIKLQKETKDELLELSIKGLDLDKKTSEIFFKGRSGAQYMYIFLLQKLNAVSVGSGKDVSLNSVSFHLKDFVDNGKYSCISSARVGIKSALDLLLEVSFTATRKDKKGIVKEELVGVRPYKAYGIKNGIVTVYLEPLFNWKVLLDKFTVLPNYFYRLSTKAGLLLYRIFSSLRQENGKIKKSGHLSLNLGKIATDIGLPQIDRVKDPKSKILDKLTDSVEEILNQERLNGNGDLFLRVVYPEGKKTVKEILDNGYIEVSLKNGAVKDYFLRLADNREKIVSNKKKAVEKAQKKALKNFALKKLEEKEAGQS